MTTLVNTSRTLKKDKVLYWVFTSLFVLMDSVPAIMFNSQMAKDGIRGMGFPAWFGVELGIGKLIGGLLLILPMVPARFKEWAYVGFGISLISAFIGNFILIDPLHALAPLAVMVVLTVSYVYFHRVWANK
ncbi:DoxX family protein [Chitinophaga sp. Cy-1792]|uniref:DoxX family protein n=1 Tax=Chitinophaga sp. Cy-1792 TaxID=2608339 RepID=UPI0014212B89|nr:DoxX family protein [Chitinophaga sp. Cy-1792]NIG53689.1 DoxX family protein [Chitinophaga sp. Cy-1792]